MIDEDFLEEDEMLEMEIGEKEEDVYSEEGREALVEDGEISNIEAGFMEGAEYDGQHGKCASCGKALKRESGVIEKDIDGEVKWFCSEDCLEDYEEKLTE